MLGSWTVTIGNNPQATVLALELNYGTFGAGIFRERERTFCRSKREKIKIWFCACMEPAREEGWKEDAQRGTLCLQGRDAAP